MKRARILLPQSMEKSYIERSIKVVKSANERWGERLALEIARGLSEL